MASMRQALADDRIHAVAARVTTLDGETEHYAVNDEGDVIVSVVTAQAGVPLWCNLGALTGGGGKGVYVIPDVGVEVVVVFDNGDFEGEAYICGYTTGGAAPAGLTPGKVLVIGAAVEIRSVSGTAQELVTKADFDAHKAAYDAHFHPTGVGPSGAPPPAPTPVYTNILKAE